MLAILLLVTLVLGNIAGNISYAEGSPEPEEAATEVEAPAKEDQKEEAPKQSETGEETTAESVEVKQEETVQPKVEAGNAAQVQTSARPEEKQPEAEQKEQAETEKTEYNKAEIKGTKEVGGVTAYVTAPVGSFEEGTTLQIRALGKAQTSKVEARLEEQDAVAFDITFLSPTGEKVQPRAGYPVDLRFYVSDDSKLAGHVKEGNALQVYHVENGGAIEKMGGAQGKEVSVNAERFSPYVVAAGGPSRAPTPSSVITEMSVSSETGGPIGTISKWQKFRVNAKFALPDNQVHANDTTVIKLPDTLQFSSMSATFELRDSENNLVANAAVSEADKTVTLTYTDYVDSHSGITGEFFFYARVDHAYMQNPGTVTADFIVNGGVIHGGSFEFEGVPDPTPFKIHKAGWQSPANPDPTVLYYEVAVNTEKVACGNTIISDVLGTPQTSYVESSFVIRKGTWRINQHKSWELDGATVTSDYTIQWTPDKKGFSINLGNVTEQDGFTIDYQVKSSYTPVDGEQFVNNATMIGSQIGTQNRNLVLAYTAAGGFAEGYVYKIKVHKESEDGTPLEGAEFNVIRHVNGVVVGTIKTGPNGDGELGQLLKDKYLLEETKAPNGYQKLKDPIEINPQDFGSDKTVLKTVTNKPDTIEVSALKTWDGGPSEDHTAVTFKLYRKLPGGVKEEVTNVSPTTTQISPGVFEYVWKNLPKTGAGGAVYEYTVEEDGVTDGKVTVNGHTYLVDQQGTSITNTYEIPKTKFTGKKVWEGGADPRPVIKLQLYRNNVPQGAPVELQNGATEYTWENLDKTDENGKPYNYRVDEVEVPEHYKKTNVNDCTVKNTYESPKIEVEATKIWVGGSQPYPTIWMKLYRATENGTTEAVPQAEIKELQNGTTTVKWTNLDKTDANGKDYRYFVREVDADGKDWTPKDYVKTEDGLRVVNTNMEKVEIPVTKVWKSVEGEELPSAITYRLWRDEKEINHHVATKDNWNYTFTTDKDGKPLTKYDIVDGHLHTYRVTEDAVPGYDTQADGYTFTNTQKVVEREVRKEWVNETGEPDPTSVTAVLLRNGTEYKTAVLNAGNGWYHKWEKLPETDPSGTPYVYTIDEKEVKGYTKKLNPQNGLTTIVNQKELIQLEVTKTWKDESGDLDKPAEITVNLYRSDKPQEVYKSIVLRKENSENEWKGVFEKLPKYDQDGKEYQYTIDEVPVPGYEKVIRGYSITNTRILIQIPVSKTWVMKEEVYPSEIVYVLLRDGKEINEYTAAAPNWDHTFETDKDGKKLPKINPATGKDYKYEVQEKQVPGFDTEIDGYAVTNKQILTEKTVKKIWENGKKPDVKLELWRKGTAADGSEIDEKVDEVLLTKTKLTHTFTELVKFDPSGKEYEYYAKEPDVPQYYEKAENGLEITNKFVSPKIKIKVTKVWAGGPDTHPTIRFQLYRNGEAFGEAVELKNGMLEYEWTDCLQFDDDGNEYEYTVKEEPVKGYTSTIDASDKHNIVVKNTYILKLKKKKHTPKTGDEAFPVLPIMGMLAAGAVFLVQKRKRRTQ